MQSDPTAPPLAHQPTHDVHDTPPVLTIQVPVSLTSSRSITNPNPTGPSTSSGTGTVPDTPSPGASRRRVGGGGGQSSKRKDIRPSTASSIEGPANVLPSAPDRLPSFSSRPGAYDGQSDSEDDDDERLEAEEETLPRRARTPDVVTDVSRTLILSAEPGLGRSASHEQEPPSEYDWASFISMYARGHWNPWQTPRAPRSHFYDAASSSLFSLADPEQQQQQHNATTPTLASSGSSSSTSASTSASASQDELSSEKRAVYPLVMTTPELETRSASEPKRGASYSEPAPSEPGASVGLSLGLGHGLGLGLGLVPEGTPPSSAGGNARRIQRVGPGQISLPTFRARSSLDSRPGCLLDPQDAAYPPSPSPASADTMTNAAAMRWAAARVSLAPLALPSPEHELVDPMRGVTATVPRSHPEVAQPSVRTPGDVPSTHLSRFWRGTTDVDDLSSSPSSSAYQLPAVEASPPSDSDTSTSTSTPSTTTPSSWIPVPLATAPVQPIRNSESDSDGDYFGAGRSPIPGPSSSASTHRAAAPASASSEHLSASYSSVEDFMPPEPGLSSVPAVPRRICLTRQTSSPVPSLAMARNMAFAGRSSGQGQGRGQGHGKSQERSRKRGRAVKEEQMFVELGYLVPPNAPDELERRRALYKFNIWNTGPDASFDRIVLLAKLVFNTKSVVISLIDGTHEWFKSKAGIAESSWLRTSSLSAHAILPRGDEPTVVLDTHEDWRFAKNPLVVGPPNIRFYASAPLRTQDGYNIGSLSVFDDTPRQEFSPRQRHTLKEFAAITMRELELWRDKIQIRIRDRIQNSMEQFTRECLEIDNASDDAERKSVLRGTSMDTVYERAAKLVKRTLDTEGAIVLDVSHADVLETIKAEASVSVVLHHSDGRSRAENVTLTPEEYAKLTEFFTKFPEGRVSEGIIPICLRGFLPTHVQYALTVPVLNVDKRPFALLCAYNASEHTKRYLEGHELSYLRAIGVIILSAVLKRRMILADRAKSLFISNISHELRTPLHGILAAAELLADSPLNHSQVSFLQTVQACGTSLVETVNHVLDFTKLSGNTKSGGVENTIHRSKINLMNLVEEVVDGCCIGHHARMSAPNESAIGSVYAPPSERNSPAHPQATLPRKVEVVVDVGRREEGWLLKCEKGGIRRVLMNLLGNSLKFTSDGYIHVTLRQLPDPPDMPPDQLKVEICIADTGKGISQSFMKDQLFHPFSQEDPLQTGTGLGLAIVNSIVQSPSVGGSIDVSSTERVGTEIRVAFFVDLLSESESAAETPEPDTFNLDDLHKVPTVTLLGHDRRHRGSELLHRTISRYVSEWGLQMQSEAESYGDIVLVDESVQPLLSAIERKDVSRTFIIMKTDRSDTSVMKTITDYETLGGFARLVYKPGIPTQLKQAMKLCLHALKMGQRSRTATLVASASEDYPISVSYPDLLAKALESSADSGNLTRRNSDFVQQEHSTRPPMFARAATMHGGDLPRWTSSEPERQDDVDPGSNLPTPPSSQAGTPSTAPTSAAPHSDAEEPNRPSDELLATVPVSGGGTLLQSSVGTLAVPGKPRALIIEDNSIIRGLLTKWLTIKGIDFCEAADGRDGVRVYEAEGPFDVVLLDLSMPVLDGIGATTEIRSIESKQRAPVKDHDRTRHRVRILALTGMSSLEDKRRAFEAGVDGYLVKPVGFKTLDEVFTKLGLQKQPD